jgi:hypothetical protein
MRNSPLVLLNINRTSKDGLFSFQTEAKKRASVSLETLGTLKVISFDGRIT